MGQGRLQPPPGLLTGAGHVHIVWDWNGTLLDDGDAVIAATIAVFKEAGLPPLTPDIYRQHFTRPIQLFYERLLGRIVDADEWSRLDRAFHEEYDRRQSGCHLAAGALKALNEVDRLGWSQSLCSLFTHDHLLPALRAHGIVDRFARIDGLRGERGGTKAEHLRDHLAALGVPPEAAILVGDTLDDASAARVAGAGCVLVETDNALHPAGALHLTGVAVVADLAGAVAEIRRCRSASA